MKADQASTWAQAIITADGMRQAPGFGPVVGKLLWVMALLAGMVVMLPSQMSIVDDFSRRWTDAIWTANRRVRETLPSGPGEVDLLRDPRQLCALVVRLRVSLQHLRHAEADDRSSSPTSTTWRSASRRCNFCGSTTRCCRARSQPRWYQSLGVAACAAFYLGLAALVFFEKQWPEIVKLWHGWTSPLYERRGFFDDPFRSHRPRGPDLRCGQGMGRATALALAELEPTSCWPTSTPTACRTTAADIAALGRRRGPGHLRRLEPVAIREMFARLDREFGRIDFLGNIAGDGILAKPEEITLDDRAAGVAEPGRRPLLHVPGSGPTDAGAGRGSIVNIGSLASITALGRGHIAYSMAMGAVVQMTRELSTEWSQSRRARQRDPAGAGRQSRASKSAWQHDPTLEGRFLQRHSRRTPRPAERHSRAGGVAGLRCVDVDHRRDHPDGRRQPGDERRRHAAVIEQCIRADVSSANDQVTPMHRTLTTSTPPSELCSASIARCSSSGRPRKNWPAAISAA